MIESLAPADIVVLALVLIAAVVVYSSIAIAQENERFAVFMMGRFIRFAGPGLVLSSFMTRLVRLKVGDIGSVSSPEFVKFGDVEVPISGIESFAVGDSVRIDGFTGTGPRLVRSALRPKIRCPECGHEF